ncbi:MAG: MscL family protein, partial [candidate division WOR-3 bacterium]|nr:MscL family protein [candidate division WOR-3 bacterium]
MSGFINFIRKQGIIGLAFGFILGSAVAKTVAALVEDIINPVIGIALGKFNTLSSFSLSIGPVKILFGHFI